MFANKFSLFLTTLLIGIFSYQTVNSQDINSLIINNVTQSISLKSYFERVSSESEFRFFYDDKLLDSVEIKKWDNGKLLVDYFNQVLALQGITYLIYKGKNVVVLDKNLLILANQARLAEKDKNGNYNAQIDIGDPMLAGKYKKAILSGYVRDGKTGEPLPGVSVYINDQEMGTVTDYSGFYKIELAVGKHEVMFSYLGFENREIMINMISPGSFDLELFEGTIAIDQVIITSKSNANVTSPEMSIIRIDAKTINSVPVLMGEPDLMKTMTLLPGIQSAGDMASGFNVRGGNTDQNLILIDDVPIYNSTHLFGMFSILDSRSIDNIELYKGGAPARFGGKASSVMDIGLKDGNYKEYEGIGSIGLYNSKLLLQGPIIKDKASFIIGGRITYSDWILKRVPDIEIRKSRANFYDFNLKLIFTLNRNNRLSFFTYLSDDYFNLSGKDIYQYGNKLGSLKWNHIISENLTFSLAAFLSDYRTYVIDKENMANAYDISSGIQQLGSKLRILYSPGSKQSIEAGIEGNRYKFNAGEKTPYSDSSMAIPFKLEDEQSLEFAGYIQDKIEITKQLSVSAGLRYSYYMILGPASVNLYDAGEYIDETTFTGKKEYKEGEIIKHYSGLEPRLGLKYNIGPSSSLKLGFSRNYQYLHILSNSTVITPTDTWKASDTYIKPAMGDQVMLGFFKNFMGGVFETSIEVYYKRVENVLEYKDGAQIVLNDSLERDILQGDMEAYGTELLIRKNAGRLTGWLSYTYSRSFITTSGAPKNELVNNGARYPSNYDKPHDLSIVLNYKLSRRFTFGTLFTYNSGRPTTYPEIRFPIYGNNLVVYSDRNEYRLKDYHRLDISLVWDTSLRKHKKFYSSWTLSVYNVYGRKNTFSTYYKKDVPTEKNNYKPYAFYEMSIIGVPIPSLTYNIRF